MADYPVKADQVAGGRYHGVAEFENTALDYVNAGGVQPGQDELKSDLNAILQPNLSEHLAIRISDSQYF